MYNDKLFLIHFSSNTLSGEDLKSESKLPEKKLFYLLQWSPLKIMAENKAERLFPDFFLLL